MFKKRSLRFRITLLVALILIGLCVPMTLLISSMINSQYILGVETFFLTNGEQAVTVAAQPGEDWTAMVSNMLGMKVVDDAVDTVHESFFDEEQENAHPMSAADIRDVLKMQVAAGKVTPEDAAQMLQVDEAGVTFDYEAGKRADFLDYLAFGVGKSALRRSLIIMAAIVLVGILLVWVLMKHALRPVTQLSNQIADIDAKRLNQSLPVPETSDEIGSLTNSFNSMLSRINQSFEEQKRFSATAAHELKTPLAAIMANIEVLEMDDSPSPSECREVLDITKENVARMDALVRNLLESYAQPDASAREECSIRQITQNMVRLNDAADDNGIRTEIHGELTAWGSYQLLERALGNLISNAYRYNKPNGRICISMSENRYVITDTGIGMPPEALKQICEPFYRVDQSRSRELGGSGLGMAIAKRIFDAYQIKMDVESELGVGTTFTLTFPEEMLTAPEMP